MGVRTVITQAGDTVDLVCWRHYGITRAVTEVVLRANPGLAAMGPKLPAGTKIVLPKVRLSPAQGQRLYS